jgi:hypothetical protein
VAGPRVLLYLLYVVSLDHGQVQVKSSPVEFSLCRLSVVSGDGELAPSPTRYVLSLSTSTPSSKISAASLLYRVCLCQFLLPSVLVVFLLS